VERLLTERPQALVPAPYKSWDEVNAAVIGKILGRVQEAGGLDHYSWGAINRTGIHHPLAQAVPLLGKLTDPPDVPEAGDTIIPRVAVQGFGASERLVVSPGHEDTGIFEMPVGQAGNPLTPYYGDGEQAWVDGTPTPLLPGATHWTLTLRP
jgi:penicillin amidase